MILFFVVIIVIVGIGFLAFSPQAKAFVSGKVTQAENVVTGLLIPRRVVTPQETEAIINKHAPNVAARFKQGWIDAARIALASRALPHTQDVLLCNKVGGIQLSGTVEAGGGIAVGGLQLAGESAIKAIPFVGSAFGAFTSIFKAHEIAVENEQNILCAAVPSANQALSEIKQAEIIGQFSKQEVISKIENLNRDFANKVNPIVKDNSSQCNAACGFKRMMAALAELEILELRG